MRAALLLFALGLTAPAYAQVNHIANSGFESFAGGNCPSSQVYLTGSTPASGWVTENGTPDHLCSYTGGAHGAETPHLYRADVAHEGSGYVLLLGTAGALPEALRFVPTSPVESGVRYTFSFWAKAPKDFEGGTFLLKGASGAVHAMQSVAGVNAWTGYSATFTPTIYEPWFILTMASGATGVVLDDLFLAPTSPLSLHVRRFEGAVRGYNAVLEWEMTEEHGLESFSVERGLDGRGFQRIGHYTATTGFSTHYSLTDTTLPGGQRVLYRLRVLDIGGVSRYSRTIELQRPVDQARVFTLVPNPARTILQIAGFQEPGTLRILAADGRVVWTKSIVADGEKLDVSQLPPGVYVLECRSSAGTAVERFVKE